MVNCERRCELVCGYTAKILIICVASTGVVLSILASITCQFSQFGPDVLSEIDPTSSNITEGWIGIFKYEVTNDETIVDKCSVYENILNIDAPNAALLTSQICAMIAPGLALFAIFVSTIELMYCRFFGSFTTASILFLAASVLQCGTFGIFSLEQGFCFNSDGCEIGKGAYFSASAVCAFWISCIILCCSPRPPPLTHINNQIQNEDTQEFTPPKENNNRREETI